MFCFQGYLECLHLFYGFPLHADVLNFCLALLPVAHILSFKYEVDLQDCDGSLQGSSDPVEVSRLARWWVLVEHTRSAQTARQLFPCSSTQRTDEGCLCVCMCSSELQVKYCRNVFPRQVEDACSCFSGKGVEPKRHEAERWAAEEHLTSTIV